MIQTLRRRFILTAMLSLMGTLFLIGIAINLGNLFRIIRLADTAIELLYRNGGAFPLPDAVVPNVAGGFQITEETPFETRYCIVYLTKKREVIEMCIRDRESTEASVVASRALVQSSRMRIRGFFKRARARESRCFCPPERLTPPWPRFVS